MGFETAEIEEAARKRNMESELQPLAW